ncbi:MAG: ROK family protein [Bacteroidales bacterium]|nr:ROK family protein [Bacteroidales bacterium]
MNFLIEPKSTLKSLSNVEKKKHLLKRRIVRYLYFHGPKSAAEISKKLKSSIPTISSIINELINANVIIEQGQGDSSGGRRPNLYGLQDNVFYILGIDIGRFTTKIGIFNTKLENVSEFINYPLLLEDNSNLINKIYQLANNLINKSGIDRERLIGVGIDMPGLIDAEKGINYTYFYDAENTLAKRFEDLFELPVYIENDANARTLAEYRYGLAKGTKNTLVLHVGWGVGLGMIINKELYRGTSGFAGEFSHIPLVENGLLCQCGKQGCLETVASGTALVRLAKEGITQGRNSILAHKIIDGQELIPKTIIEAANEGDQFAISIIAKVGFELGKGIATLIQLFNPELIILGGRVAEANQYLLTPIEQALNHYSIPKLRNQTKIQISKLGTNANILGAVAMVSENIFEK